MDELTISHDYVKTLIEKVQALMVKEETVISDIGSNPTDDVAAETLQEFSDDLTREELIEEMEGLAPHERTELVALMWVGRGDADPDEWTETLQLARQRHEGPTTEYLLGQPLLADYWAEGLEKLGY